MAPSTKALLSLLAHLLTFLTLIFYSLRAHSVGLENFASPFDPSDLHFF